MYPLTKYQFNYAQDAKWNLKNCTLKKDDSISPQPPTQS